MESDQEGGNVKVSSKANGMEIDDENKKSRSSSPSRRKESPSREDQGDWKQIPSQIGQQMDYIKSLITKNPWDAEARERLIKESIRSKDKDLARKAFAEFTTQFPTCVKVWIQWIEYEKNFLDYDQIETIFQKCIRDVPSVALYTHYLEYIQYVHNRESPTEEEAQASKDTITKAFDYVLNAVGNDIESGQLWMDYIQFIKNYAVTSSYEEQQKMDHLRKIFHKAIHIPTHKIEDIWKEYDTFENNLNKLTAKKFISDRAAGYMTARTAIKDLKALLDPIEKIQTNWIACPPTWSNNQVQTLNLWKRYIAWETSNPLHLEDKGVFLSRVMHAYKSALIMLRHFAEIWYDAASFLAQHDRQDESIQFLQNGLAINETNLLLAFTLAERQEAKKVEFSTIQQLFDRMIEKLEQTHSEVNEKYDRERTALFKQLKEGLVLEDNADEDEGERRERERELAKEHDKEVERRVESQRKKAISQLKKKISLVWIVYMRLTRRSQNIKAARLVFSRARKTDLITSHVFVASALMEYYVNKDPVVAGKIFELGMKTFPLNEDPESTEYILRYLDFLMCLNDDNNTRALFERSLSALPATRSKPVWQKYIDYETQYGDLSNLYRIETRWKEAFTSGMTISNEDDINSIDSIKRVAHKWRYFDIDVVGEVELGIEALERIPRLPPPAAHAKLPTASGSNDRTDKGRQVAVLGGVDVDKFPRPEISRWTMYKPEPGTARVLKVVSLDEEDLPDIEAAPAGNGMLVPEPIANFYSMLPRKENYNGPILNIPELVSALYKSAVVMPIAIAKYVPLVAGKSNTKRRREDDSGRDSKHNRGS